MQRWDTSPCAPAPGRSPSEIFHLSVHKVRLEMAKSLFWPLNNPEGRKTKVPVPMEREGGTRMLRAFPDSVSAVQKLLQKTLCFPRSPLHIDAFRCKPHCYAGRRQVSIQKLCRSRGGRRKEPVGGRTVLGHLQTPGLKSIFSASKSEASVTPGRLHLAATAGLSTFKQPSRV